MRIQYCSDLHLEFEGNLQYLKQNPWEVSGEILVLAGDIAPLHQQYLNHPFFDKISELYRIVFWLPGNHEYYHKDMMEFPFSMNLKVRNNIFIVNNINFIHGDVHFIFSTLWASIGKENEQKIERFVPDFKNIQVNDKNLKVADYNQLHWDSLSFIKKSLHAFPSLPSVIVTHHLPSKRCNAPAFRHSAYNEAFCTELSDFIHVCGALFWIYGHSHYNQKPIHISKTILLTNQLGNVIRNEHLDFHPKAYISI
jgi:hypothetical protein